ncbi:hypothetical protein GPJ56_009963 [Histomonas meleagridis]|uniref:uncharacterized protein n=1 Tax=Histomonas meleagridis TaxID=135588 RepID=UPI00355A9D29|nr:hypothetical protein GPJ56_009963 [Histomonas meleagridis]KAH0802730.1 hypothetical protein GO595_004237 [Histomonas meleagridis]
MLCVAGAKILKNEFPQPEVIITDSTKTEAIKSQFITELAKGTRIAPRIILAQQIPWAFVKPKRLQISEKSYEGPKIVLADLNHSARPNFLVMNDYPKLYLIPSNSKDYLLSPFVQPPTNLDVKGRPHNATQAQNNRHNFQVGPGNYGYCEICGVSYHDGTDHRNSAQHLSKVNNIETFAALDEFALSFCKLT